MIGVALTVALFAFFWVLRGKLNTWGLEYVQVEPHLCGFNRACHCPGPVGRLRDLLALPQLPNGRSAAVRRVVDRCSLGTAH